jgi:hypothetical protein
LPAVCASNDCGYTYIASLITLVLDSYDAEGNGVAAMTLNFDASLVQADIDALLASLSTDIISL